MISTAHPEPGVGVKYSALAGALGEQEVFFFAYGFTQSLSLSFTRTTTPAAATLLMEMAATTVTRGWLQTSARKYLIFVGWGHADTGTRLSSRSSATGTPISKVATDTCVLIHPVQGKASRAAMGSTDTAVIPRSVPSFSKPTVARLSSGAFPRTKRTWYR